MRAPHLAAVFAELDATLPDEPDAVTETRLKAVPSCTQADHDHAKRESQFPKLEQVGVWDLGDEQLLLGNCPLCHSTLARKVTR